jgi:hypothetical protein
MSDQPATAAPPAEETAAKFTPARKMVRFLLVLGVIFGVVAVLSVWVNRQLLNSENWADTSTQVLSDKDVQQQLSAFIVDQVYSNVDVAAEVERGLPPRAKPLVAPVVGGLRTLAERLTVEILQRPRVQSAWYTANKLTAQQFLDIAEGKSQVITTSGGAVVLDLRPIVLQLVERLGLPAAVAQKIPPTAGKLRIMSAEQVDNVSTLVRTLRVLAFILPWLMVGCFALAIYLARGRRRRTILIVGWALVLTGALVLIARNLIGDLVVDSLAKNDAVRPAAESVWSITTHMLRDIAQAVIIAAIPLLIAAWLAGPRRVATSLRRSAAPWLREQPVAVYTFFAVLAALIVLWGPIPATQKVVPVIVMLIALVIGIEALRRQTAEEFPDATSDDSMASLRGLSGRVTGRSGAASGSTDPIVGLERLTALREQGALDEQEFQSAKAQLLRPS